ITSRRSPAWAGLLRRNFHASWPGLSRPSTSCRERKTWMRGTSPRMTPRQRERPMLPPPSPRSAELAERITAFMDAQVYPAEPVNERESRGGARWDEPPVMSELKNKAKAAGLWNLFVPKKHDSAALSVVEYAPLCEIMGRSPIGAEPFN